MNNRFKTILFLAPLTAGLVFTGCGSGGDDDHPETDTVAKVDSSKMENNNAFEDNQELIGLPAPSEMLGFIKMTTKPGNKSTDFLNPTDNIKNYMDNKSMALNFGIYSCDLTYCSIFGLGTVANQYFKNVKTLGEEIGVSSAITPQVMKRAESNVSNSDSLAKIADEIYLASFEMLEENQKGPTLALVIAGGYVESMNIAASVIKFDPKNPAVDRFSDQKYNLENIVLYLKKYESDASVAEAKKQLEELKAMFDQIKEVPVEVTDKKTKKVSTGTVLEITKEQFQAIAEKIKTIRNNFAQIK